MIETIIIFAITLITMILSLILFPKIKIKNHEIDTYWIICLLGAILLFIFKKISINDYLKSLFKDSNVNPIKILVLFFSMTVMSIILDELGLFKYIAIKATNLKHSNQFIIFTVLYFVISILTVFTSNDIIILTFTPFICYFAKNAKINPIPYLIGEFIAANTLSMAFLIGNPTNIYLGLSLNITFIDYFKVMFLRSIIVCFITYILLIIIFYRKLKENINKENIDIKLENKSLIIVEASLLLSCIILMAISSYIDIEMYLVSLLFSIVSLVIILIFKVNKKDLYRSSFKRLPYPLIPFLLSMFAIVISLENVGVVTYISNLLVNSNQIFSIGYLSFITCSITNNIPMSVLFSSILNANTFSLNATYAAIIGSNIGALFSPLGALAGIMFINLVNKAEVKFSYKDFIKYNMPISIILITISLLLLNF